MDQNDKPNSEQEQSPVASGQIIQPQENDGSQNGGEGQNQPSPGRIRDILSSHKGELAMAFAALVALVGLYKNRENLEQAPRYGPNDRKLLELATAIEEIYKKT